MIDQKPAANANFPLSLAPDNLAAIYGCPSLVVKPIQAGFQM
ncbi:hypothetical protein AWB72_03390 [Caballeronia concitans]|uniref:Uncharacterized protein n=1 Tax=Caballeronia concitans TaxID=1777133 RepID=A0A658QZA6_9BURK|nr:hypothetical protein AWB72_03390 [Caballeronia concitans]